MALRAAGFGDEALLEVVREEEVRGEGNRSVVEGLRDGGGSEKEDEFEEEDTDGEEDDNEGGGEDGGLTRGAAGLTFLVAPACSLAAGTFSGTGAALRMGAAVRVRPA